MTRSLPWSADERAVLGAIFWSPAASRRRLARPTGFSNSKADLLVTALIADGLLDEGGVQASSGRAGDAARGGVAGAGVPASPGGGSA